MNRKNHRLTRAANAVLLAAGLLGASVASAQTATTAPSDLVNENAQLRAELQKVEQRLDQVEAQQNQANKPAPASAAANAPTTSPTVSQAANNAVHQADKSNPLLFTDTDLVTGYDPSVGFVIRNEDNSFSLHPGIVADIRNMTSYRTSIPAKGGGTDTPTAVGYNTENGFDLTRLRLTLDGHFTDPLYYFVQVSADQGAPLTLLDAYVNYHLGDSPFTLRAGQFKDPLWHERNLSEAKLLTVDRSLTEALLGGGQTSRVQGVGIAYDQDRLRGQFDATDGFNSLNTKFIDSGGLGAGVGGGAGVTPDNFGFSARGEYLLIGDRTPDFNPFSEYDQFTALNAQQDILVAGAGADWTQAGANDVIFHTVDAQYDSTSGFSAFAAYLGTYRDLADNQGVAPGFYYDPGFQLQAAYILPNTKLEPFARYDYTYLAGGSTTALNTHEVQEITVGANYYIHGQNIKLTVDGSYLPNGAPADSDALGILQDSGKPEYTFRAQFQIAL
jgi:hypothetical protein